MTERVEDSTSRSPLMPPREQETWHYLKPIHNFKDVAEYVTIQGPKYTRQGDNTTDIPAQSRLNQFFIDSQGQWFTEILQLKHHADTVLSDHDPVSFTVSLDTAHSSSLALPCSTYFKANPVVLTKPEIKTIQSGMADRPG
jgi:hypothetical protein